MISLEKFGTPQITKIEGEYVKVSSQVQKPCCGFEMEKLAGFSTEKKEDTFTALTSFCCCGNLLFMEKK